MFFFWSGYRLFKLITNPKHAANNIRFENWIIYLQNQDGKQICPRCKASLMTSNAKPSRLCERIFICSTCAWLEVTEWVYYATIPAPTYKEWLMFEDFRSECKKYGVNWDE